MKKKRIGLWGIVLAAAVMAITLAMPKTLGYADNAQPYMHEGVEYLDLAENLSDFQSTGGYYYLSDNYTISGNLVINADAHLYLNHNELTIDCSGEGFRIKSNAKLTIEDGNMGTGMICTNSGSTLFVGEEGSELTIRSGAIRADVDYMFNFTKSNINIEGGNFTLLRDVGLTEGIMFNSDHGTVNIGGGYFEIERGKGKYFRLSDSKLNINTDIWLSDFNIPDVDIYIEDVNSRINLAKDSTINRPLAVISYPINYYSDAIKISDAVNQGDLCEILTYSEKGYTVTKRTDGFYLERCSIDKLPSDEELSVEATPDFNLTYEWGVGKKEAKVITVDDVDAGFYRYYERGDNYNAATQTFTGREIPRVGSDVRGRMEYDYAYMELKAKGRQNILIEIQDEEVPDNLTFVSEYGYNDPVIEARKLDNRTYLLYDLPEISMSISATVSVNARFSYIDLKVEKEIESETQSTYGFSEPGSICCKVTWNKGLPSEYSLVTYPVKVPEVQVDFDSQGGSKVASSRIIKDSKVKEPTAPVKDGYKFEGWYVDKECNTAFDFTTKLDKDITLYAKWTFIYKPSEEEIEENSEVISKKVVAKAASNGKLNIVFNDVKDANEYDILASYCGSNLKFEKNIKIAAKNATVSTALETIKGSKIDKKRDIKFVIVAYKVVDDNRVEIGRSYVMHIAGKGSKYTNPSKFKSITKSLTIKKGKSKVITYKLAKENPKKKFLSKKHGNLVNFYSSDEKIAKVDKKTGKVKALKKGTCKIYAVTINGIKKTVKVTVK